MKDNLGKLVTGCQTFLDFAAARETIHTYIYTYIHKEYLYRAYYPNSKSLYALSLLNEKVFSCRLKVANEGMAVGDGSGSNWHS